MYLVKIFRASPLMALALCMCLATILWCILLTRRQQARLDRTLTGLLGMIAIYEALRVLKDGEPKLVALSPDPQSDRRSGVVVFPMTCHSGGSVDIYMEPVLPDPVPMLKRALAPEPDIFRKNQSPVPNPVALICAADTSNGPAPENVNVPVFGSPSNVCV